MKSSSDEAAPVRRPDGDPSEAALDDAAGLAQWLHARSETSTTGDLAASRLGKASWALYESARDPFVLLITIYLFAPYFTNIVIGDGVKGQALLGEIQAYSGILIGLLAPFLGAVADKGGRRKPWIALYTAILAGSMFMLWFSMPHAAGASLFLVCAWWAIANVAFEFSAVFHNSMLPSIATQRGIAGLSGLALALGNAAGIVLLLFMLIALSLPGVVPWSFIPAHPLFGVDQAAHEPERLAGPVGAVWLLLLAIPLFLFTPDRPSANLPLTTAMREGARSVIRTIRAAFGQYRNVGMYLVARLFFNDGMTAVLVFGGAYASSTFHWGPIQMLLYGIELSIFAMLGGFFGGFLDNVFGSKRAIFISIGGTTLFLLLSLTMAPDRIFWFIHYDVAAPKAWSLPFFNTWPEIVFLLIVNFIAVLITAGYANSRTMLARIAPVERMTEFFGLYSLSGQSTSFLATGFVSWLTVFSDNQRIGLLGEAMFLLIGLVLMFFVREERATPV